MGLLDLLDPNLLRSMAAATLVTVLVLAVVGVRRRRVQTAGGPRRRGRLGLPTLGLLVGGTLGPLLATLTPNTLRIDVRGCHLGPPPVVIPDGLPFAADVALNSALLLPLGIGLGLAPRRLRRRLLVPALLLSPAIETVQALVPGIYRFCQVSDAIANVGGLLLGLAIGLLLARLRAVVLGVAVDEGGGFHGPSAAQRVRLTTRRQRGRRRRRRRSAEARAEARAERQRRRRRRRRAKGEAARVIRAPRGVDRW
ncbi:MAG: VanZ family protein [Actinomycetes bacterium]